MIGLSECIFVVEPLCFDLVSEIFKAVAPNFFYSGYTLRIWWNSLDSFPRKDTYVKVNIQFQEVSNTHLRSFMDPRLRISVWKHDLEGTKLGFHSFNNV